MADGYAQLNEQIANMSDVSLAFFVSPDPTFFAQVIVGAALIVLFEMSLILVRFL